MIEIVGGEGNGIIKDRFILLTMHLGYEFCRMNTSVRTMPPGENPIAVYNNNNNNNVTR
jgi:hypothetical protein